MTDSISSERLATRQVLAEALEALFIKDALAFAYQEDGETKVMLDSQKVADMILAHLAALPAAQEAER
jgi:hypothetical protein